MYDEPINHPQGEPNGIGCFLMVVIFAIVAAVQLGIL